MRNNTKSYMTRLTVLLLYYIIVGINAYKKSYAGYEVLRVYTNDAEDLVMSELLGNDKLAIEFWGEGEDKSVNLEVPPEVSGKVKEILRSHGIIYDVEINNLQSEIDRETEDKMKAERRKKRKRRRVARSALNWRHVEARTTFFDLSIVGEYVQYDKMVKWLKAAEDYYPELVQVMSIGTTTEGRQMYVIKISTGDVDKPAIWLDANIHAREWITSATAIFLVNQLLTGYGNNHNITSLVQHYNWYILPVANPDGFQYSHTTDRLWRLTRSLHYNKKGKPCYGVDPNRNWDFHWMDCCHYTNRSCRTWKDRWGCASDVPCYMSFAGPKPFSEPETRNMADFLLKHNNTIKIYISLHSFLQMWFTPWAFTLDAPADGAELERLAKVGTDALYHTHNTSFTIGSPAKLLYTVAGSSYDWAKGVAGIPYSYTLELRDKGKHGFVLPMDQIIPTGEEVWAAIQAVATELKSRL